MAENFVALGVPEALAAALAAQKIEQPLAVQKEAIPRLFAGENLAVEAPTGTGKTLAYLLPALARLDATKRQAQAVVLAPTYELSMQVARVAQDLVARAQLPVRAAGFIGGANLARQVEKLKEKPQLVIGSAGRLVELSRMGKLKLADVNFLVLDEFDRLLDDQNLEETADFLRLLDKARGEKKVQYALFSATATKKALGRAEFLGQPALLRVAVDENRAAQVTHCYAVVPFRAKAQEIRHLVRRLGVRRGIVFLNRAFGVTRVLEKLRFDGITAAALVGQEGKAARQKAIADFTKGKVTLLLATDLAARGLDIPSVDTVFQLDFPEDAKTYLHRAGRTGRAGETGRVVTLVDEKEASKLARLEQALHIEFQPLKGKPARPRAGEKREPRGTGKKQGKRK